MAGVKRNHQLVLTWRQCLSVWQDLCTLRGESQPRTLSTPLPSQHTHTHTHTHTHNSTYLHVHTHAQTHTHNGHTALCKSTTTDMETCTNIVCHHNIGHIKTEQWSFYVYSRGNYFTQKFLYVHAEWTKTRILYGWNFDFHFQIGDMPPRVFPICLYREAMRLQCFPPTRYVRWARILRLNNWRPFTTWLRKARICSVIDVLQSVCTCFFFCLVCGSLKLKKLIRPN